MEIPSRNKTDNIFEKVAERFPFLFEDTKEVCYCHLSKGLYLCLATCSKSLDRMFISGIPYRVMSFSITRQSDANIC